jgi:hypothetical protein
MTVACAPSVTSVCSLLHNDEIRNKDSASDGEPSCLKLSPGHSLRQALTVNPRAWLNTTAVDTGCHCYWHGMVLAETPTDA